MRLLTFSLVLFLLSCSSREKKNTVADSVLSDTTTIAQTIRTDSGQLVIRKNGEALLLGENGKLKASGYFDHGAPSGAWVHYDENGKVVTAKFLVEGKVTHELDKKDFDFRTYENQKLGVKFLVPKEWKELPSPNPALLASFEKEVSNDSVTIKPNFNVTRAKLGTGDNLQKLAAMQMDILRKQFGRVDPIQEENFTVDSCSAFRRYGMYYIEKNTVGYLNAIIVNGSDAWFFSCEAQNKSQGEFLLYQGVFQKIVDSFERVKLAQSACTSAVKRSSETGLTR